MRTAGIVTYYLSALPRDEQGQTLAGLVQVTDDDAPLPVDEQFAEERHVYISDPSLTVEQLPGTPAFVAMIGQPWTTAALAAAYPNAKKYVLSCEWEDWVDVDGVPTLVRLRAKEIKAPLGATLLRENIPLNRFAGETD